MADVSAQHISPWRLETQKMTHDQIFHANIERIEAAYVTADSEEVALLVMDAHDPSARVLLEKFESPEVIDAIVARCERDGTRACPVQAISVEAAERLLAGLESSAGTPGPESMRGILSAGRVPVIVAARGGPVLFGMARPEERPPGRVAEVKGG